MGWGGESGGQVAVVDLRGEGSTLSVCPDHTRRLELGPGSPAPSSASSFGVRTQWRGQ